jgi:hypothetical protein
MKKFYHLLSLFLLVGLTATYADTPEDWGGYGITTVKAPLTGSSLTNGTLPEGLYLMRNVGRGGYVYEAAATGQLTFNTSTGQNATTDGDALTTYFSGDAYMNYVVKVVRVDKSASETDTETTDDATTTEAKYQLQWFSGNWMAPVTFNDLSATCEQASAGTYVIGKCTGSNDDNLFYLRGDGVTYNSANLYLDGNASRPVGWNSSPESATTGNNSTYVFYPVELGSDYVKYTIQSNGTTIGTSYYTATVGSAYPTITLASSGCSLAGYPEGTIAAGRNEGTLTMTYDSSNPFTISESVDNATWMKIWTRGDQKKWLYALTSTTQTQLSTTWKTDFDTFGNGYATVRDGLEWCLVGDPIAGFVLYNKLAKKYIQTGTSTTTQVADAASATRLDLVNKDGSWFIRVHGTENNCLSDLYGKNPNVLYTWNTTENYTDAGSKFVFSTDDVALTAANLPDIPSYVERSVGFRDFWDASLATSELTGEDLYNAVGTIAFDATKYYKIRNSRNDAANSNTYSADHYRWITSEDITTDTAGALSGNTAIYRTTASGAEVPMLWRFEAVADDASETTGRYHLRNANTGLLWGHNNGSAIQMLADANSTDAGCYTMTAVADATGQWVLADADGTGNVGQTAVNALGGVKAAGSVTIGGYSRSATEGDPGFYWYIIPVESITLTVGAGHWAAVCYPFAVTLPEGLTAYVATSAEGSTLTLSEYSDVTSIPAHTPVLITDGAGDSEAHSYTVAIDYGNTAAAYEGNLLAGATAARSGFDASSLYTLGESTAAAALLTLNSSDDATTIAANSAYLLKESLTTDTEEQTLTTEVGVATGLHTIAPTTADAAVYYDLQGRRVLYPAAGVYVTAAGQKVYVK